ncbi:lysosomal proton-coupled steroid conjugate and bile acid symporter SLC46A3-like [Clytia hemisphaerica]|uniref:Major facilitator superfamily (MFS) profile domain-containing protein n=1 Tax=Clytia hemisphaerica TaxID=252671 RepID=A0A7M5V355_9CNID|eukprot:TCONS_00051670-protein
MAFTKFKKFIRSLRYYPELLFVFHLYGVLFSGPTLEQYLYKVFSDEVGYNYTYNSNTANSDCNKGDLNSTSHTLLKEVQDRISKFQLYLMLAQNIPPILLVLFFGPLADRYGRKVVMMIAFIGYAFWSTILTAVVYFNLSRYLILVANFIWGCCGYYLSAVVALLAYVSDRTQPDNRAFRIAIVDLVLFAAITASNFSNGKYLQEFGFLACFLLMFTISIVSVIWCFLFISESLPPEKRTETKDPLFTIPRRVLGSVIRKRPNRKKLLLLMVVDSTVGFTAPVSVQSLLILILLNIPFCWPSSWIGYYRGALFAIMGVGGVIAVKLLPYIMAKPLVIIVACLSSAGYLVSFSLSRSVWASYVSILAGLFAYSAQPITRGIISQIVDANEQGAVFSVLGFFQTIVSLVASLSYNAIYIYTNQHNEPAAVFIIASFTTIIPIIFSTYFYYVEKKNRNTQNDDENTEQPTPPTNKNCNDTKEDDKGGEDYESIDNAFNENDDRNGLVI